MMNEGSKYEVCHLKNCPNINVNPKNDGKDCRQGSVGPLYNNLDYMYSMEGNCLEQCSFIVIKYQEIRA